MPKNSRAPIVPPLLIYGASVIIGLGALKLSLLVPSRQPTLLKVEGPLPANTPVRRGIVANAAFVIQNCSKCPIEIDSMRTSCTCVRTDKTFLTIAAGASSQILVSVDTSSISGIYSYNVECLSNKSREPVAVLPGIIIVADDGLINTFSDSQSVQVSPIAPCSISDRSRRE